MVVVRVVRLLVSRSAAFAAGPAGVDFVDDGRASSPPAMDRFAVALDALFEVVRMTTLPPSDTDLIFVPAQPIDDGSGTVPAVELRRLRDSGERVGLAFSSVDALVTTLGRWQPWVAMSMAAYVVWLRMHGVVRVHVDPIYDVDVAGWSVERVVGGEW